MNLSDALHLLAAQLGADADTLIAYAAEDEIGGFNFDAAQSKWQGGSIWEVEGKMLYALTRALKPLYVAEFGVNAGCSSTHFLAALAANEQGVMDSVDPWEGAGQRVPHELRTRWHMHFHTGTEWLEQFSDGQFDVLFEDMVHGWEATGAWWRVALRKIAPGGVIISHDATHPGVGTDVQRGIREAGVVPVLYSIEPSDCGLAIWYAPAPPKPTVETTTAEVRTPRKRAPRKAAAKK